MERKSVTSSNITSIGYDSADRVLEVEFHSGAVYRYYSVPAAVHAELMAADSHGSYLARHVKGRYDYREM